MRRVVLLMVATVALGGAGKTGTVLDGPYAPDADGRVQFTDAVGGTFEELAVLAPLCGFRDHAWGQRVDDYLYALLTGHRDGSGEDEPTPEEAAHAKWAMAEARKEALTDLLDDRKETCRKARDRDNLRVADKWAKAMAPGGSWSGAGGIK